MWIAQPLLVFASSNLRQDSRWLEEKLFILHKKLIITAFLRTVIMRVLVLTNHHGLYLKKVVSFQIFVNNTRWKNFRSEISYFSFHYIYTITKKYWSYPYIIIINTKTSCYFLEIDQFIFYFLSIIKLLFLYLKNLQNLLLNVLKLLTSASIIII